MDEQGKASAQTLVSAEMSVLARKMAAAYARMAEFYRGQMGMAPAEADAKAREPADADYRDRLLTEPPDQVSWWAMSSLMTAEPETAVALWERIKQSAREEGRSTWDRNRSTWRPQRVSTVFECLKRWSSCLRSRAIGGSKLLLDIR